MTTKYPSLPIPSANVPSMYQAILAMRQQLALLNVNSQPASQLTLTQASQIFSTKDEHGSSSAQIAALQAQVNQIMQQLQRIGGGTGVPEAPLGTGETYGRGDGQWEPVLPLDGGTLTGALILNADPVSNLQAATKEYVDSHSATGGTITGVTAGTGLTGGGVTGNVTLALSTPVSIANGGTAATTAAAALTSLGAYPAANPQSYVNAAGAAAAAPVQSVAGRTSAVTLTHTDITDWTATLAPYAPLASPAFTGAPSLPTGSVGVTQMAGDNTTALATTAFVTAAVTAAGSVVPSDANPVMDGAAAPGSSALYSRGDHVHPTDISRYSVSNPSGYQTAAQVAASLGGYLPLTGGTLTGELDIQAGTPRIGLINGSLGQSVITSYKNDLSHPRWDIVVANTNSESGSNAGSNFQINRYTDAGAIIDAPFSLNRASGSGAFNSNLSVNAGNITCGASALATASSVIVQSAINQPKQIVSYSGANVRWNMQLGDGGAESGSNAGANFVINSYTDAGAWLASPLYITRSNSVTTIASLQLGNSSIACPNSTLGFAYWQTGANKYNINWTSNIIQLGLNAGALVYNLVNSYNVGSPYTGVINTTAGSTTGMAAWSGSTSWVWTASYSSARELKKNLKRSTKDALATINTLPVYECDMAQPREGSPVDHWDWSLIADEVEPLIPLAVRPAAPEADINYPTMIEYPLIVMLIRAVQQLSARVETLERKPA